MKNLIKNVVRSFKNNKLSIIGLVLLLFFGLGVFCVMSNTTSNIKNEYTSLAQRGNLHDFTVSELYDVGKAEYRAEDTVAISFDVTSHDTSNFKYIENIGDKNIPVSQFFFDSDLKSPSDGTYYIPMPEQTINHQGNTYYCWRTYHIVLDANMSTGLYKNYAQDHAGTGFVEFEYSTKPVEYADASLIPKKVQLLYDTQQEGTWETNMETLCTGTEDSPGSLFYEDYHDFNIFISDKTSSIYSLMTTGNTPLAKYLDSNYADDLYYRYFKSVNVTASTDNVFYKIINSNPEDQIDKMVLFEDPNRRTGNYLYSIKDWAPFGSDIKFTKQDGSAWNAGEKVVAIADSLSFIVPSSFNELAEFKLYPVSEMSASWSEEAKYFYSQVIQIRFKRMLVGDYEDISMKDDYIRPVASIKSSKNEYYSALFASASFLRSAYTKYCDDWYDGANEILNISANGNVVFTWTNWMGVPSTLTISNWTSKLSIVNPQHLEKTSQRVISPLMLNEFEPYKQWYYQTYGSYPIGEINAESSKSWFNTLSSDQFNWWINPSTKADWTTMTYNLPDDSTITMNRSSKKDKSNWNGIDKQYIASCSGYDEIIWGCGLTPDFMYPVVDISRPTPNTKTECLVYANDSGYNSIKLAFVNSPVEDYLIARFKPNVNTNRRHEVLREINKWATGTGEHAMIYPEGTTVAFFADDTSNVLNCSGFRIAYIPHLVNVVQTVSTVLCVFIGILCLVICFVIIKRYVENNRINIGIMRANGIKKWKIALSLFPFALLPAIIGGIAAYVVGLLLQGPMLMLFSNYWMLPTPLFGFDWISFLVCIFAPFLLFTLICFVSTFVVLRTSAVSLMKAGSEFKTNSFSRIAKKPFKHFGVLTRFRVSLAFNSITRLLILAAMSCLTMSSLVFAMTTFDKLSQSKNINSTQFNYDFNVELTTPSSSGGPYSIYDYSEPLAYGSQQIKGYGWTDPEQYLFNIYWDTTNGGAGTDKPVWYTEDRVKSYHEFTKPYMSTGFIQGDSNYKNTIGLNGLLMIPSAADADGQAQDLLYLQNKRSSRLTLNYDIGVPGIASSNPWEIALALMPANSRNLAADSFNVITQRAGEKAAEATQQFVTAARSLGLIVSDEGIITDTGLPGLTELVHEAAGMAGPWFKLGYYEGTIPVVDPPYWYSVYPNFFIEKEPGKYVLDTSTWTVAETIPTRFNSTFVSLLTTIYQDPELLKLEYPIEYGAIPLNWDLAEDGKKDETYTYINGYIKNLSSGVRYDPNHQLKVEGIKEDSNYIFLTDKDGHALNDRLWSDNYLHINDIDNETTYPIIINAYVSHKYRLNIGSTITINKVNDVDRFLSNYDPDADDNLIKFKVVGVSVGTNNEAWYTRQDVANNLLGLPNGVIDGKEVWNRTHKYMMWYRSTSGWDGGGNLTLPSLVDLSGINPETGETTDYINVYNFSTENGFIPDGNHYVIDSTTLKLTEVHAPVGFNGIYTHNKTGKPITAGLSLYSYTGLYPGTSVFKSQSTEDKFVQLLGYGPNLAIANLMTGIDDKTYYDACYAHLSDPEHAPIPTETIAAFVNKVTEIYGDTTMITAICGAIDVAAADLIYSNLISTFNLAETTIMAIIIPITIIIVAVISNLIINDSRRMAAMLKALGYSDIKNLMSILALFIPTIVLGLILAIPLSFGLTLGYQSIIFNTANILVDVTQKWWYYVAAIGGIGVILIGTYAIGYVSLKRSRLVDEIK